MTAEALRPPPAVTWDDLAAVVELTGDAQHRHIPGSVYDWRHTWIPLTEAAARSHGHGKIPKGWSAPSGGGGGNAAHAAGDVTKQVHDEMAAKRKAAGEANARATIAQVIGRAKPESAAPAKMPNPEDKFKGVFKHPGSARLAVQAMKETNAGRFGNAIGLMEKTDGLEAHEGVMAGKDSRQKIAATITSLRARQAVAVRKDRAAAKAASGKPSKPKAGSEKQLGLISERMSGGDRTSGEMKAGDMQEGHQAIAQAPAASSGAATRYVNGKAVKGAFSDPWWMAKPGGGFAISQRWQSKEQQHFSWTGGPNGRGHTTTIPAMDERVLTPVTATDAAGLMRTQAASAATTNSMWAGGARRLQLHAVTWDDLASVVELAARTVKERTAPMTTVMAVNPQVRAGTGSTPAKAAGTRGANSVPPATAIPAPPKAPPKAPPAPAAAPPAPRRRQVPLTPMRQETAKSLRKLAAHVQETHPDMTAHQHLRDAARVLESGNEEGAQRHLRAAVYSLTPQSLLRHGVHDDHGHIAARQAMHGVHRHLLLVKDIQDAGEKNRAAIARHATEDMTTSPPPPAYGGDPGALAQKPVARQPGGDRALNAPARTNSGGSDPAVADPVGPQPKGSKQFATWDQAAAAVELAAGERQPATWDDHALVVASVVELSARTPMLEATPAPYGKPGGPGLYHVKGLKHSDYLEQIVHALMTKRGMDKGRATAIARGAIRKWARGGGKVHSEVRAAAAGAEAEELKAQARAHAHATSWDDIGRVVDLASRPKVVDLVGPHGYIHGWIYVGGPGLPSVAAHNAALKAKGVTPPTKAHPALTSKPPGVKAPVSKAAPTAKPKTGAVPPKTAAKPPGPPKPAPAAAQPAAAKAADAGKPAAADRIAAAKGIDELATLAAFGGKSVQKAVLKKKSLADLQGMDAEYTRRGSASGKILGAHQLVKDEITSRGATPLPAPSPDELKASHAAAKTAEVSGPATKQDLISAWSTSYRYTGKTEAKDKRIAAFATEMHRLLSTNKQPSKCGPGCQDAHKFLGMVDKESAVQPKELQRGLTLSSAAAERMFKPGKTMDMPVGSWTSDDKTASDYAKGKGAAKAAAGKTKVVLHAAPGAKGLDISGASIWKGENEVVTGGRFSVDKVQTEGGVMNVYLTQKDFSAH